MNGWRLPIPFFCTSGIAEAFRDFRVRQLKRARPHIKPGMNLYMATNALLDAGFHPLLIDRVLLEIDPVRFRA